MSDEPKKGHGGPRPNSGRKKGQLGPSEATSQKIAERVQDLANGYSLMAIETLADIARNTATPPSTRVSAANAILDRSIGKPKQEAEVKHTGQVSLIAILDKIRAKNINLDDID
jgi:hypothetical protein